MRAPLLRVPQSMGCVLVRCLEPEEHSPWTVAPGSRHPLVGLNMPEEAGEIEEGARRRTKRSVQPEGAVHWFTWSCERRLELFHRPETRAAFVESLLALEAEGHLVVYTFVVMPEHVHALLGEGSMPLEAAVSRLKGRFAIETLRLWDVERPRAVAALLADGGPPRVLAGRRRLRPLDAVGRRLA